jgi:hypothetical protein
MTPMKSRRQHERKEALRVSFHLLVRTRTENRVAYANENEMVTMRMMWQVFRIKISLVRRKS